MSELTGLYYSENNYDLKLRLLSRATGTTVILENSVSLCLKYVSQRSIFLLSALSETLLFCDQKLKA